MIAPDEPAGRAALAGIAALYAGSGRFARHYVAGKLRRDPVHADILAMAARERFGHVVDVGCGRGQLAVALLAAGRVESVLGIDWNAAHLAQAAAAARAGNGGALALRIRRADVGQAPEVPACDTVILVDVLYQLETAAQMALLARCADAARARVLVRTADPERGARSAFTRLLERLARRVWPHSGATVNARPIAELAGVLARAGFAVKAAPCWRGTPFANVLLVARRTGVTEAAGWSAPASP